MRKIFIIIPLLGMVVLAVLLMGGSARAASLPEVVYLGEGSGTYQTERDSFVVKRFGPFRFDLEPGPTYEASSRDRVWEQSGAESAPPGRRPRGGADRPRKRYGLETFPSLIWTK